MPRNKLLRLVKALGLFTKNLFKNPLPLLKSLNVLRLGRDAASLNAFYRTLIFLNEGSHECDIVHCHFGPNGDLGALLKSVGAVRGKVVTTFHGYDLSNYLRAKGSNAYDSLFRTGDLFLPISERWKEELVELGCNENKIVVHRMGVDLGSFAFSPRQLRDDGRIQLLTVARLVEKKGVRYGIQAVAKLLDQYQRIEYRIVGDGPLKDDIGRLIDELGIGDRVKLLGWKRQAETIELMKEAHIFLAPSVTGGDGGQEGIPVALMEALAQGLPVVSTQHGGIPELIQDGKSGFLVPERDVDALARKLEYLIQHPEIWPEMGRAGRDYVEMYYDIDKLNDRLVGLFQRLLDGSDCIGQTAWTGLPLVEP